MCICAEQPGCASFCACGRWRTGVVRCNACRPDGGRLRCGCCWRRTATGVWWQGGYNEHSSRECRLRALEGVSARIRAPSITDRMATWHLVNASHVPYERQLLGQELDEQKDHLLSASGLRDTSTTRSSPASGAAAEHRLWWRASACPDRQAYRNYWLHVKRQGKVKGKGKAQQQCMLMGLRF